MNRLLAAHLAAGDFNGPVRNYFVGVHVGLRAASRLPDVQREMLVELARDDFVGRLCDQLRLLRGEFSQILVYQRRCCLEYSEGANQFARHRVVSDIEVNQRARGLRAVIAVHRNRDFAHAVRFDSGFALNCD